MNPNFNWAIVAERMQTRQAEADTAARARHAARTRHAARIRHAARTRHAARIHRGTASARLGRRFRRGLGLVPAGPGR